MSSSARLVLIALASSLALLTPTPASAGWDDHDSTVMYYEEPAMQANSLRWVPGKGPSAACPKDGYDYCAMLEFCEDASNFPDVIYGYREPCLEDDESLCECKPGPGPTIRLEAGNKYLLTLRNAAENPSTITNLHTHGLHIVGAGDGDDVTRHLDGGGNCLDYTWDIHPDHPGGTSWYHAHHHGYTDGQVGGGAFGMIVIEDNLKINPDTPEWASNEVLLQIARVNGEVYANGNTDETIKIDADQWYRFRVSFVDPLGVSDYLTFGAGCEFHKVASDGIWRSRVPGPNQSKFLLTGSTRTDFAVRCQSSFHVLLGGAKAATVYVGQKASNPYEMTTWNPKRPAAYDDIMTADVPDANKFDLELTREGINDILWDPTTPLATIAFNEVHEWTITRSFSHPFHMHLYHVMVVTPGGCGEQHEEGEFYDTISGIEYEECRVRFKTADIGQRAVLHCHVLSHEDNGAMGWVDVVGGPDMPRNDVDSPQYTCPAVRMTAAPTVEITDEPTARPTRSPTEEEADEEVDQPDDGEEPDDGDVVDLTGSSPDDDEEEEDKKKNGGKDVSTAKDEDDEDEDGTPSEASRCHRNIGSFVPMLFGLAGVLGWFL